jgi:hypothetical protein
MTVMFSFLMVQGNALECDGLPSLCYRVYFTRTSAITKRRQVVALQKFSGAVYPACRVSRYLDQTNAVILNEQAPNVMAPSVETPSATVPNATAPTARVPISTLTAATRNDSAQNAVTPNAMDARVVRSYQDVTASRVAPHYAATRSVTALNAAQIERVQI